LQISLINERIGRQRKLVENLGCTGHNARVATYALCGMEATLSALRIRREAVAWELLLRGLGPSPASDGREDAADMEGRP
jgi:hypothetical protein